MKSLFSRFLGVLLLIGSVSSTVSSQMLRTSFVMKDVHYRMQLNPALVPDRGYVDIPVVGNFNFGVSSNALGSKDIIDAFNSESGNFSSDVLYDRLKKNNDLNMHFKADAVSVGWWRGENFWSISVGMRMDVGAQIPKSMFTALRDMEDLTANNWDNYRMNINNEKVNFNAYSEMGVGFARDLSERVTFGAKLKMLLGMGNLNATINAINIETNGLNGGIRNPESWANGGNAKIQVDAVMESSLNGMKFLKDEDGTIYDFDYNQFGIAGFGGAIDLGLAFHATDNITLSAAVSDLGFISWAKSSTSIISSEETRVYDRTNYLDFVSLVDQDELLNYELFGFKHDENAKGRTTSLYSAVSAGAEVGVLNDKLTFGVLSTTRLLKPKTLSEITFAAAIRPASWFDLAASYSLLQSNGKTFGVALKLGPLFVGSDYVYLGDDSMVADIFAGLTIPLGRKN